MHIPDAQREMRQAYLGGFAGQTVSGVLWLAAAALGTWGSPRQAILLLVVGGIFIFPLTVLLLRLMGRPPRVGAGNTLPELGWQVAMPLPLALPVVAGATLYRLEWFFPAMMVVLGAHYLPFGFLYGMRLFPVMGFALVAMGVGIGMWASGGAFALGGWLTGAVLLAAAVAGRWMVLREEGRRPG